MTRIRFLAVAGTFPLATTLRYPLWSIQPSLQCRSDLHPR